MITTLLLGGYNWESFYVVGSSQGDNVSVKRVPGNPFHQLIFTAEPGSAQFDTSSEALAGCEYAPTVVKCKIPSLATRLDSITLAGMGGDDRFSMSGELEWEAATTPTLIGGQGNDTLIGSGQTEDVLIDGVGAGADNLFGFAFDDALLNNEGADRV